MGEGLHDLLEDAAARGVDQSRPRAMPHDLWTAGRRQARTRRLGTAAIVATAVVALALTGVLTWRQGRATLPPSSPAGAPGSLPSRLYQPSRHLPGTRSAGPLGQVAAVMEATRKGWGRSHHAYIGVSAIDGAYRFLDLPGLVPSQAPLLSPDGRHVFYWTDRGRLTGRPGGSYPDEDVSGFAVYDAGTGRVTEHPVTSAHGLVPATRGSLWLDPHHLLLIYGEWMGGSDDPRYASASDHYAAYIFDIDDNSLTRARGVPGYGSYAEATDGAGRIALDDGTRELVVDLTTGRRTRYRADEAGTMWMGSYSQALSRRGEIAYVGSYRNKKGRRVAGLPGQLKIMGPHDAEPTSVPVPAQDTISAIAWIDRTHVAAFMCRGNTTVPRSWHSGDPTYATRVTIASVDVSTGATRDLVRLDPPPELTKDELPNLDWCGSDAQVATDLLAGPTRDFPPPPHPWSPWVPAGGAIGIVVVSAFALIAWRRRRVRL